MCEKKLEYRLSGYCDVDYAGVRMERKCTSGNCQFLGNNLISWASKRQSTIALSTAEAEYISASLYTTQMLWMKNQLEDLLIFKSNVPIFCDNTAAICLILHHLHSRLSSSSSSSSSFKPPSTLLYMDAQQQSVYNYSQQMDSTDQTPISTQQTTATTGVVSTPI
ncbi:hypothetical protein KIW84_057865 [Lathyrus oleraceus]|uniref:Retrovirus-related Pol polyprotein from transposon TNT 1-94 n=1 Tax=Pisum sativum TaxID=3888 RepID=A0A9D4X797_PEA|nr:hypothetical protein KIW84_057865 [Pisum sativum]